MQPRKKAPATPVPAPTILIVEGNTLVRALVAAYLRDCGYQVIESSTADEATDVLRARKGIAIVFIDVDTDGNGFSLARRLRNEWPEVKVLLSSGIRRTAKEAETLCERGPTSNKPYDHAELARRIRRLVAS